MDKDVFVYVDLNGAPQLAGRLWARSRKGKESATFEYSPSWLEHTERFALESALTLGPGPFHTRRYTDVRCHWRLRAGSVG